MALSTNAWLGIGAVAAIGSFFLWKTSKAKSLSAAPNQPTEGATDTAPAPTTTPDQTAQANYGQQLWDWLGSGKEGPPKAPALDATGGYDLGTVTGVQGALQTLGYTITVDGKYGPKSKEAVKSFQASRGLKADAVIGGQTREALQKALVDRGFAASYKPTDALIKGVYSGYPLHYYYGT
jgi:peptidoglycan hydrolase-like protein with peptidoglycan-binding domain